MKLPVELALDGGASSIQRGQKSCFHPWGPLSHPACPRLLLGSLHKRLSSFLKRPRPPGEGALLLTWEGPGAVLRDPRTLSPRSLGRAYGNLQVGQQLRTRFWLYLLQNCFTYGLVAKSCLTLRPHGLESARLLCPWNSPGKNTGVGCRFLLQGDLPDPGIEPASPAVAGGFFVAEPSGKPCVCVWRKPRQHRRNKVHCRNHVSAGSVQ